MTDITQWTLLCRNTLHGVRNPCADLSKADFLVSKNKKNMKCIKTKKARLQRGLIKRLKSEEGGFYVLNEPGNSTLMDLHWKFCQISEA